MKRRRLLQTLLASVLCSSLPAPAARESLLEQISGLEVAAWPQLESLLDQLRRELGSSPSAAQIAAHRLTREILREAYRLPCELGWRAVPWAAPGGPGSWAEAP